MNLVASGSISDQAGRSRPISGDTLGDPMRGEIPLEPLRSNRPGKMSITPPLKESQRDSPSPPAAPSSQADPTVIAPAASSASASGQGEDIIHGGAHYSQTANRLDPRAQDAAPAPQVYQASASTEAGKNVPKSRGWAWKR